MNVDEVWSKLNSPDFPREAVQWSLDNWEEASARFISKLRMLARHGSNKDTEVYAAEYAFHLCAEKRDSRALAPLCDLIATDGTIGDWLIDADLLPGLLINLCDGDLEPLQRAIEAPDGDQFMRGSALEALAYLVRARGVLSDDDMREYLAHLHRSMEPRGESYVWAAWALSVARLGYEPMRATVGHLFSDGFIHPSDLELADFYEKLQLSRRDADGLAAFDADEIRPSGATIETYEPRAGTMFPEDNGDFERESFDFEVPEIMTPHINPHRDVGRNDPCICGSGKKYKKCCLAA